MIACQDNVQADAPHADDIAHAIEEPGHGDSPPQATVARRVRSYSDLYDALTTHLAQQLPGESKVTSIVKAINTDLDFENWYHGLEEELLEASHDDYQYAVTLFWDTRESTMSDNCRA